MAGPIYNPGEPYMLQIPGGFAPGRICHVTGTFKPTANSFILKFQSGPSGDPADEIGLCMYGRVAEGVIGRNSFTRAAGWGQEEASNSVALARGQNFDVTILCDAVAFKIALNSQHFGEYSHRTNPASLTYVSVASTSEDMTLACLWIEDPGAPVPPPGQAPYTQAPVPLPGQMAYTQAPVPPPGQMAYTQAPVPGGPYAPAPSYGPPPPYSGGPGFAPPFPDQQMYPQPQPGQYGAPPQHGSGSNKGLLGMVAGAGTAVAGALGASHLLGKKAGGGYPGQQGGFPGQGGYPGQQGGYPGQQGGYPGQQGGYPGQHGGGGGGLLNKAMAMGGGLAGGKMMGKPSKALKYGAPLAGLGALGAGGYMLSKGLGGMGGGFHCGSSSSSSGGSSEEEEEE